MRKQNTNQKKQDSTPFWKDYRFKFILGLLLCGLAIFLTFAFVSYITSWRNDQSLTANPDFGTPRASADNQGGHYGFAIANWLMDNWFGLAAFGIPFFLAVWGLRLLKMRVLPFYKTLFATIFGVIIISVTFGFIDNNIIKTSILSNGIGGAHGNFMSLWLQSNIGAVGTIIALLLAIILLAIFINRRTIDKLENLCLKFINIFKRKDKPAVPATESNSDDDFDKIFAEQQQKLKASQVDTNTAETQNSGESELKIKTVEPKPKITKIADGNGEMEVIRNSDDDEFLKPEQISNQLYDPTLDLSSYKLPPIDLLDDYSGKGGEITNEELERNKNKIVKTLGDFRIGIDKIIATPGATVTLYEIVPKAGVKVSTIKKLEDDIALRLSAVSCRIIAPIPGKGTIGIEIPNENPAIVSMKSLLCSKKYQESKFELPIVMGKTIQNETFIFDLCKMPHLLVAGATGQGKSVGLNAIITSLLYKKHPSQLKFVMVDPKKVEFTLYSKLKNHFMATMPDADEPIITDNDKAKYTLKSLCILMDHRYDLLKLAGVRKITEYNEKFINRKLNPEKGHEFLPYIVVVIDEFADLIMTAGREVEEPLARLAQLARAVGIHLVIATQRPTTNIITGLIKANFPARIAFKVTSMIDSRTILDQSGANQLIGRGDMLISTGSDLTRLQCALIETEEAERIVDFISQQQGYTHPYELPEYEGEDAEKQPGDVDLNNLDKMFEDAAKLIVNAQQGSTSLIQRKLQLGYNRAGRIMDQLEAAGIVGPYQGSKARDVLITDLTSLDQILSSLLNK